MQMNGINALIDVAKYRERWSDPRLVVLVLNNRDLNQVTWEQRAMAGDPKFEASQALPDFPTRDMPSSSACTGIRVEIPDDVGAAWERRAGRRPAGGARGGDRPGGAAAAAAHRRSSRRRASPARSAAATRTAGSIIRQSLLGKVQELRQPLSSSRSPRSSARSSSANAIPPASSGSQNRMIR